MVNIKFRRGVACAAVQEGRTLYTNKRSMRHADYVHVRLRSLLAEGVYATQAPIVLVLLTSQMQSTQDPTLMLPQYSNCVDGIHMANLGENN